MELYWVFEYSINHAFENVFATVFATFFTFLSRNYLLVQYITNAVKHKEDIKQNVARIEDYKHEFLLNVVSSTTVETATYILIQHWMFQNISVISYKDILFFIPTSFLFELIFDFFHYWTHRILHSNRFLYIHIHKKHHKYSYPSPILTFYHSPFDLIITNSLPQFAALALFPRISFFQFNIILVYKSFIEISGHSSKKLYPSGSFSQFIWLPKLLGISLYTEDHTLHHSNNNCNYAKLFSFWDKLFGTYEAKH
jgi:sterol desaturase/sphingolipid hydroxylase (fatty acid hydroxylase superfamily)